MKPLRVIDLYCGAGGTSTGLLRAAASHGLPVDLTPINHWPTAVETHAANHPQARHICASIEDLRPEQFCQRGDLDWLVASPECTHFSRARGGLPVDDQRRVGARRVLDWAERLAPRRIWIENVREFLDWGPLVKKRGARDEWIPDPRHKGALFHHWAMELALLGYRVEWRLLNCADHGAPTTRTRLIVQASRKPLRPIWPTATHADPKKEGPPGLAPWRTAGECIDWSIECPSIFDRKKPLSANTLKRIESGLGLHGLREVIVSLRGTTEDALTRTARSVEEPLSTLATGRHHALVRPFIIPIDHTGSGRVYHATLDRPLSTLTTKQRHMLVTPHLVPQQSCGRLRPVSEPCPTISTAGAIGLLNPVLIQYYGTSSHSPCSEPLPTLTCKPRFGLAVRLKSGFPGILDIGYRMLHWRETAAAQSFPSDYRFCGTATEIHKQIGNAVPPALAEALFTAALRHGRS